MLALSLSLSGAPVAQAAEALPVRDEHDGACDDSSPSPTMPCRSFAGLSRLGATGLGLAGLGLAGLAALLGGGKGGSKDDGSKEAGSKNTGGGDDSPPLPADSTATAPPVAPGIRPPASRMPGDEAAASRLSLQPGLTEISGQRDLQGQTLAVTPPGMINTGLLHNGMLRVGGDGLNAPAAFYNQGRVEHVTVSLAHGGTLHNFAGAWLSPGTRSDSDYGHGAGLHNHGKLELQRPLIGGGELVNQHDGQMDLHGQGSVHVQENASFTNHGSVTASRAATGNDSLAIYMNGWSYGTGQTVSTGRLDASGGYGILNTLSATSDGSHGGVSLPPGNRRDLFVNRGHIEFKAENGSRHAFFIRRGHAGHDLLNAAGSTLTLTGDYAVGMRSDSDSQLINRGTLNLGTRGTRDIGMTGMMLGKGATGVILNDTEGIIHVHARQSHAFSMASEHGLLLNRGQVLLHCGDHSCSSYDSEATRARDALGAPADRDFRYHPHVALALGLPAQEPPPGRDSDTATAPPPPRPVSLIRTAELGIPEHGALTNTGQIDDAVLMVRGPLHNAPSGRISLSARDSSQFHHTVRNHGTLHVGTTLTGADTGRLINERSGVITLNGKGTIRVTAQSLFVNHGSVTADHAGSDNAGRFILTQSAAGGGPARPAINTGTLTARGGYGVVTLEASDYQKRVFINRGRIFFTAENGATRALHVPAFNNFNELVNDKGGTLTVYGNNAVAMSTNGMATRLVNRGTINLGHKDTSDSGMVAIKVGAWGLPDGRQPAVVMRSTILNDSSGIINVFARRSFAFRVHQPAGGLPPAAVLLNRGQINLRCDDQSCRHSEQTIPTSDSLTRTYHYALPDLSGSDDADPVAPAPDDPPRSGHHLQLGGFAGGLFVNTGRFDQLHLDTLGDVHNTGTGVLTLDDTQHGQIRNALWNDGLIHVGTRLATLEGGRFVNKPDGQLRLTGRGSLFASSDSAFINRGRILAEHATDSEVPPALLVMDGSGHNNGSLTKFNAGDMIARGGYEAVRAEAGNKRQMFANHGTIDFTAEQGASRALSVTSPASNDHDLITDLVNDHHGVITVRGDNAVAMSSDTHSQLINRGTINLGERGSHHVGLVAMEQRRWRGPRPRSAPSLLINEHGGAIHVNTRQSYAFRSGQDDALLINRGRIFLNCGDDSCRYFADDDTAGTDITQTPAGLQFSYDASVPAGGANGYEADQRGDHGPRYGSNGLPVLPEAAVSVPATTSSSVMREHSNSGAQDLKGQVHVITGHERLTNTGSFSHGTLQVQPEGILLNRGSLRHAVIDVRGALLNRQGAHITLSGKYTGSHDASGVVRAHGLPSSVSGKLSNEGTLTVHTPLNGSGLFGNLPGGVLNLAANGSVHLTGSGRFVNHGRVIAGETAADDQAARTILRRDGWHSTTPATAPLSDSRNTGSIVASGGYAVLTTTSAMQAGRSRFSNSGSIKFTATPETRHALSVRHGHHGHDLVNAQLGKITILGEQAVAMYSDSDSMVVNNGAIRLGEPGTRATGMIAMALGPNAGHGATLLNDSHGEILIYARQSHAFAIAGNGSLINRGQVKLLCGEQEDCSIYRDVHTEGRLPAAAPPGPDSAQSLAGYVIGTRPDGGAGMLSGGHLNASGVTIDTGFATDSARKHVSFAKVLRGSRIDGIEQIRSRNAAWRAQAYRDADGDVGVTLTKHDYRDLVPQASLRPVAAALERGYDGGELFRSLELGSAAAIGQALHQLSGAGIASTLKPLRTLEQRFVRLDHDMPENRAGFGLRLVGSRHGQPEARLGSSSYDLVALRQRFEFGRHARLTAHYGFASVKPGRHAADAGLDGHSQLFGLHYTQALGRGPTLEGAFRYAQHRIDTRRTLRYGDVDLRPQASQRRDQFSHRLALVLPPLPIGGLALEPLFGLALRHQRDAALTERDAGAYALRLSASHDSAVEGVFGLRFRYDATERRSGRGWRADAELQGRPTLYRQAGVREASFASAPAGGRFALPADRARFGHDGRLGLSHQGRNHRFELNAYLSRDGQTGDRGVAASYRHAF